jgi:hypothetical protein
LRSLITSFLAGWGGWAFFRAKSSSRAMEEGSKTTTLLLWAVLSWWGWRPSLGSRARAWDLAFFIGGKSGEEGGGEEVEVVVASLVAERLVGSDMKWK